MALDFAPPLGSQVIVYGQRARVIDSTPASLSFAAAIRVAFPLETDFDALPSELGLLARDGDTRCGWVSVTEPSLRVAVTTVLAESPRQQPRTLTALPEQWDILRQILAATRDRCVAQYDRDAWPVPVALPDQPTRVVLAALAAFLVQLSGGTITDPEV